MTRILIDQDSVIYDLTTPWYNLHNEDFGHIHEMTPEKVYTWDTSQICRDNNCPAHIYDYFDNPRVWYEGTSIGNSKEITRRWVSQGYELGVISAAPNAMSLTHKKEWLYAIFPHIKNVIFVNTHIKHWVTGDFLIDDALHNHEGFTGISIVYDGAWNRDDILELPRARDWDHVDRIIQRGVYLLDNIIFNYMKVNTHKIIQGILYREIEEGKL